MHNYWTWFDIDVASGLNAHLRYLANTLEDNSCLNIVYLDQPVEIPIQKHCFKTKPDVLSSLIRTSHVGRRELQEIQESLHSNGFSLKLRRSPKRKFLNQVVASVPIDEPTFPLEVRQILATVAETLGKEMPARVGIGYYLPIPPETLPGIYHYNSDRESLSFNIGKKIGYAAGYLFKVE
jgi:hypothetical protein